MAIRAHVAAAALAAIGLLSCSKRAGEGASGSADAPSRTALGDAGPTAHLRFAGRVLAEGDGRVRMAWPGSAIHLRFRGAAASLAWDDASSEKPPDERNHYRIVVDGLARTASAPDRGQRLVVASGLVDRIHEASVVRLTEAFVGEVVVGDVDLAGGTLLAPTAPRPRSFVVVGDSISCGYGALGASPACSFSPHTESVAASYGAVAADRLDAELTTLCWSGKGVVRNVDGSRSELMPELFERTLPARREPRWDFASARPIDAIVVNLGTNDLSRPDLDEVAFVRELAKLLERARQVAPRAEIVVVVGPMLLSDIPGAVRSRPQGARLARAAVEARVRSGDGAVTVLEVRPQRESEGEVGCDGHPSAKKHGTMGQELARHLEPLLRRAR